MFFFVFGLTFDLKLSHYRGLVVLQLSFYVSDRALKFGQLEKLDQTPLCLIQFFEWIKHSTLLVSISFCRCHRSFLPWQQPKPQNATPQINVVAQMLILHRPGPWLQSSRLHRPGQWFQSSRSFNNLSPIL